MHRSRFLSTDTAFPDEKEHWAGLAFELKLQNKRAQSTLSRISFLSCIATFDAPELRGNA